MTKENILDKIKKLREQLAIHNKNYYELSSPTISDGEFDKLFSQLKKLEDQSSLTSKVSATVNNGGSKATIKHGAPMLSIYTETDYNEEGVFAFTRRVSTGLVTAKATEKREREYCCELKFDGLALSLKYQNGVLVSAATRGDGEYGEDVLGAVMHIPSIPKVLEESYAGKDYPDTLEVRGEALLQRDTFKMLNQQAVKEGTIAYVNPRNAAAGILRSLGDKQQKSKFLSFFAYSVALPTELSGVTTQSQWLRKLSQWGLPVYPGYEVSNDISSLYKFHQNTLASRSSLNFDIDGVVYKVNSLELQKVLGVTGREPKWATAHKFPSQEEFSNVTGIIVQVGRTGKLTPVASIEPVFVGGTTITNITLHNQDEINRLGIGVGSRVVIRRAGDVIPEIISASNNGKEITVFQLPHNCPDCGTAVMRLPGQVDFRCPANTSCPSQSTQAIIHFCSRKAMNITGLGEKIIGQLTESGHVISAEDIYCLGARKQAKAVNQTLEYFCNETGAYALYALAKNTLLSLDRMGDTLADSILASIQASKSTTLEKLIYSLGIRYAAEGTAKRLAKAYSSIESLSTASISELEAIEDIGPTVAKSVFDYFQSEKNLTTLRILMQLGVNYPKDTPSVPYNGINIAITGTDFGIPREEIKKRLEAHGYKVVNAVNSSTNCLIAGNNARSKLADALKFNTKIIPLHEFNQLLTLTNWELTFRPK